MDGWMNSPYTVTTTRAPAVLKTPILMDNFSDRLTFEGAGGQTDDTENFQRENFSGQVPMEFLRIQDSEKVFEDKLKKKI